MATQELRDAMFIGSDQRANFKQIIAKRSDLAKFARGRMVAPGSLTTYEAGTVLGQVTASGLLKPYDNTNTDGSEVAIGVLAEQATVSPASGDGGEVVMLRGATVFFDKLIAPDTGWIADLGGKQYVEGGVNLIDF